MNYNFKAFGCKAWGVTDEYFIYDEKHKNALTLHS